MLASKMKKPSPLVLFPRAGEWRFITNTLLSPLLPPPPLSIPGEWGFNDFLRRGLIEYLDVNEENVSLIALYETHCTRCGTGGGHTCHISVGE